MIGVDDKDQTSRLCQPSSRCCCSEKFLFGTKTVLLSSQWQTFFPIPPISLPNLSVFALADGCNWGVKPRKAARVASLRFCESVTANLSALMSTQTAAQLFLHAFDEANMKVLFLFFLFSEGENNPGETGDDKKSTEREVTRRKINQAFIRASSSTFSSWSRSRRATRRTGGSVERLR